jgi:hypothetical protein
MMTGSEWDTVMLSRCGWRGASAQCRSSRSRAGHSALEPNGGVPAAASRWPGGHAVLTVDRRHQPSPRDEVVAMIIVGKLPGEASREEMAGLRQ